MYCILDIGKNEMKSKWIILIQWKIGTQLISSSPKLEICKYPIARRFRWACPETLGALWWIPQAWKLQGILFKFWLWLAKYFFFTCIKCLEFSLIGHIRASKIWHQLNLSQDVMFDRDNQIWQFLKSGFWTNCSTFWWCKRSDVRVRLVRWVILRLPNLVFFRFSHFLPFSKGMPKKHILK